MNSKYAILLSTVVFPGIVQSAALDGYVSYSSVAHARHSSDVLYGERHVLLYREGRVAERVVLDTCRYGSAFRRKLVSYPNLLVPDFLLEDAANGMREGIRERSGDPRTNAPRTVFYRERGGEAEKSGPLPAAEGLVADAGFDEFVPTH
jgi:hypothetical protein